MCAFLLAATWPTLAALPALPSRILAGDVYVITQGSGDASINDSLVQHLTAQAWASIVSPEILSLGTVADKPVLMRSAEPATLVRLEGGAWIENTTVVDRWAFAGEGLARRLGLATGDYITLVGSFVPRFAVARIAGIYRTDTFANDELVVDFAMGRFLTGLAPSAYHSVRVMTSNPMALLSLLEAMGVSVHVSGPGLARADILSDPPTDERLTNFLLRSGRAPPRDYLSTAVSEATISVRVVAIGTAALLAILVAFGIHAVQARAFADHVRTVGVLRTLGAGNRWMRRRLFRETVPYAFLAGATGAGFGFLVDSLLRPTASLFVFGHQVPAIFDAVTFALIVLAIVAASIGSSILLLRSALRVRPTESIQERAAVEPPESLEVVLRG